MSETFRQQSSLPPLVSLKVETEVNQLVVVFRACGKEGWALDSHSSL